MGFVVLHPSIPEYKPTPNQVQALIDVLAQEQVIGQPSPHLGPNTWEHGPGFHRLNIAATSYPATLSVEVHDSLSQVDDPEAEDWERTLSRQYLTITIHEADPLDPDSMSDPIWRDIEQVIGCPLGTLYWHV